jgi:N-acetylglucosaminyldiphosphoundecaprenol N-acetyl-beta-D-mannosaminyltransferase
MTVSPSPSEPPHVPSIRTIRVLGTPLLLTDYRSLARQCLHWARQEGCLAMDFANTQTVTMNRHESDFRVLSGSLDYMAPDGMPLIWCLNRAGARLGDRVYGPRFMRHFLSEVSEDYTHYLIGGSEECGRRLREKFLGINPKVRFVGGFHGRCAVDGTLEATAERHLLEELRRLRPDFIWVKREVQHGVILTVGFGFDVNAGMKPDQPMWMQKLGLGWVFRLVSEPRRLLGRYLKYNTLFLFYLLWDGLRGRAWQAGQNQGKLN